VCVWLVQQAARPVRQALLVVGSPYPRGRGGQGRSPRKPSLSGLGRV